MRARGTSISLRVLHKHLRQYRQVRGARLWVEVRDRAHRLGLRGPRGVSTPLYHKLSVDQPDMQGTFLLLHVLFKFGCIIFIIVASFVMDCGLEVEASGKTIVGKILR